MTTPDAPPQSPVHFGNSKSRVLVTGATGFIGQLLVRALLADGHEVVFLTRQRSVLFEGPVGSEKKVKSIHRMEDLPESYLIDVIINLAGARILGWRWTEARKKILLASRVQLTQRIIEWVAKAEYKPKLLLSASAIGYYGIQPQGDKTPLNEQSSSQPIFMSELCQQWEAVAQTANHFSVPVAIMRFGLVLGKKGALPMMLLPIKLGLGGALGSGEQWISWIHVHDVLRAIAHVWQLHYQVEPQVNHDPAKTSFYNFTAPEVVTQKQFSQIAAKILHRPCVIPTPAWPMRLALGEQADLLLEGQFVEPKRLLETQFEFSFPDLCSALKNLV
jgi:uncharacterized protein